LINDLRNRERLALWHVMALVNEGLTIVGDLIRIRRTFSNAHQENAVRPSKAEIHPTLKRNPLFRAHLHVGDDLARGKRHNQNLVGLVVDSSTFNA
jgi:hypothetical protein